MHLRVSSALKFNKYVALVYKQILPIPVSSLKIKSGTNSSVSLKLTSNAPNVDNNLGEEDFPSQLMFFKLERNASWRAGTQLRRPWISNFYYKCRRQTSFYKIPKALYNT